MKGFEAVRRLGLAVAGTAAALVLLSVPSASASSVVYIGSDSNVHLVSPDGAVKHQVTSDATADFPYRSPSQTTAGEVVAIRKIPDPEGGSEPFALFLDRQTGAVTDNWLIPPRSGVLSFSPVTGGQISPDGGMFVYDSFYGPGAFGTASIDVGFVIGPGATSPCTINCEQGYMGPRWIPGTPYAGFRGTSNETIYVQSGSGPQPWVGFSDPNAVDLDSFDVSTTGRTLIESSPDGVPDEGSSEQSELGVYSNVGTPGGGADVELRCYVPNFATTPARPHWSPDGSMIAWEGAEGVYTAPTPTTTGGGVCALTPKLVAAGGKRPDWGAADTPTTNAPPTANAGGPYTVTEGASLALTGSGTDADGDPLTYSWDVNGDGTFGDASGRTPSLTWAQLVALGINDGSRTITAVKVRVSDGTDSTNSAATTLNLTNKAPSLAIGGPAGVNVGAAGSWTFSADDAAAADDAAGFTYAIDWNGDGTADETVSGTSPKAVSHTFSSPGSFTIKATARDKDAGTSPVATKAVTVSVPGEPDGDGDGLPDSSDQCPTQPGPGSNNGCPTGDGGNGDTVAPDTVIDQGPKKKMKKKQAKFVFHATEAGSSFECSLNDSQFASCTSPHTVKAKKGKNTFQVRATDQAGNTDQSPATWKWKFKKKKK